MFVFAVVILHTQVRVGRRFKWNKPWIYVCFFFLFFFFFISFKTLRYIGIFCFICVICSASYVYLLFPASVGLVGQPLVFKLQTCTYWNDVTRCFTLSSSSFPSFSSSSTLSPSACSYPQSKHMSWHCTMHEKLFHPSVFDALGFFFTTIFQSARTHTHTLFHVYIMTTR